MSGVTTFTQEKGDAICELLIEGESLRAICKRDDMPGLSTVFKWLDTNESFQDQYARARAIQADILFDEILVISDDGTNDFSTKENADGSTFEAVDHDHIQRSKLRVDSRKWMAGKLLPKKYGEKIVNEVTGKDGEKLFDAEPSATDIAKALLAVLNRPEA